MLLGDELSGLSISIRDRDDIIQIWNADSELAPASSVIEKVKEILPNVVFTAIFYKGGRQTVSYQPVPWIWSAVKVNLYFKAFRRCQSHF